MNLTIPQGSYLRAQLLKNRSVYNFFQHKQLKILFPTVAGRKTQVTDGVALEMLAKGLIEQDTYQMYRQKVCDAFPTVEVLAEYDRMYVEEVYAFVHNIRKEILGVQALEQYNLLRAKSKLPFDLTGGIDQRIKKEALLQTCDCVLLLLCDTAYLSLLAEDLSQMPQKDIYILVSKEPGNDLPDRALMEQLLQSDRQARYLAADEEMQLPLDNACLLAYGEEALLHCRGLELDCIIHALPKSYYAQAQVNQIGMERPCLVYVPKGLDIVDCVPLTDKSRLTYWQLFRLWKDHGDGIYQLSEQQLYRHYPQYFLNIYDNRCNARDTQADFPVRIADGVPFAQAKEQAICAYLQNVSNIAYGSTYTDGILVHHAKITDTKGAQVINCEADVRGKMADRSAGILSNFLFFLTDKLKVIYNDLRADRPYEQVTEYAGHLDYMLSRENGTETFPLFHKGCIAKRKDGSIAFFHFRLGGGKVCIGGIDIDWSAEAVDTDASGPVQIYTPYYSVADELVQPSSYCKAVGHDRLNIVILQNKICCIRKGDVLLPGVGVVVSLEKDHPLGQMLRPLADGYYSTENLTLTVSLDPPEGFSKKQWEDIQWAYGGGMFLIRDGVGVCDDDQMEEKFRREGWLSPLSWQTQESALHDMVKHPRTALGLTEDGALVMLAFSGRTIYSTGADYKEMIRITRQIYPNIRQLINVDGGGSTVLGLVTHGSFMELNVPAASAMSCVGMVRPVYTTLYIPLEHSERQEIEL